MNKKSTKKTKESDVKWYHWLATGIVGVLVIIAVVTFLNRFNLSLLSGDATLKFADGCSDSEDYSYIYMGVNAGDLIAQGGIKVSDESMALIKIKDLQGTAKIDYRLSVDDEWQSTHLEYGEERKIDDSEGGLISSCKNGYYLNFAL